MGNPALDTAVNNMTQDMDKTVQALQKELSRVRTGRASPALLDTVHVDYYGSSMPLAQVSNITTPDARTLQVVPWEASMLGPIEKAILAANIGFTPQNDGKLIRLSLPALNEERRKEMGKSVRKMGEESKVALRNRRRDANEEVKKLEKGKSVSEDESRKVQDGIQKKTDEKTAAIDKLVEAKEKEILSV